MLRYAIVRDYLSVVAVYESDPEDGTWVRIPRDCQVTLAGLQDWPKERAPFAPEYHVLTLFPGERWEKVLILADKMRGV